MHRPWGHAGHSPRGCLWTEAPLWELLRSRPHPPASRTGPGTGCISVLVNRARGWAAQLRIVFAAAGLLCCRVPRLWGAGLVSVRVQRQVSSGQFLSHYQQAWGRPGCTPWTTGTRLPLTSSSACSFCPPDNGWLVSGGLLPPGPFVCIPGRKEKSMSGPFPSGFHLPGQTLLPRAQGTGTFPSWPAVACLTGRLSCWYRSEGQWTVGGQPTPSHHIAE